MPEESLPAAVRLFISRHLASVEQLEILLWLVNRPDTPWTADAIYQVILSNRTSVENGLEKFVASGLLVKGPGEPPSYCFKTGAGTQAVVELSRYYKEMPVRVIEAIYQKGRDNVQGFADAFKFKREP